MTFPVLEDEQLIVFAEVQLLLATHLVGAEVCACLQISWKLIKGLHYRIDIMSIEPDTVRCCAVWLLAQ